MTHRTAPDELRGIYIKGVSGQAYKLQISASTKIGCKECVSSIRTSDLQYLAIYRRMKRNHGWDEAFTASLVNEYARFLELMVCMQDWKCTKLSPSPLIDVVWKEHMKDSREYTHMSKAIHELYCAGRHFEHSSQHKAVSDRRLKLTKIAYHARFCFPPDETYWGMEGVPLEKPFPRVSTCQCLKQRIYEHDGIPPDEQRLLCGESQLEDGRTLSEYNIRNGTSIYVVLKMRRG